MIMNKMMDEVGHSAKQPHLRVFFGAGVELDIVSSLWNFCIIIIFDQLLCRSLS